MPQRTKSRFARLFLLAAAAASLGAAAANEATQPDVFNQLDLLVDVRHELVAGYVEEPDQSEMVEAAVRGMVQSLDDPYTAYLTQDELDPFDKYVRGSFTGIGAEIDLYESRPRIVTPLEDSPAWNAGIRAGDVILEIDGVSTLDTSLPDAVKKLTGEKGTAVRLKVRHESGEEEEYTITRDVINVQTVRGFRRDTAGHYDYLMDDEHGVGYVRITQFSERTAGELRPVLEALQAAGAKALILDVRFNPGGLLQSAVEVSDMFLPAGKRVVSVKGRVVPEQVYDATSQDVLPDMPVVVLANEASASAAEIVAGALADNDRALFVGARTFGKGSVQQVKMLETGAGALKLTNAYYYVPSGRLIHRREGAEVWGVDPREGAYVPMSPEQVREMIERRREADILRKDNGGGGTAVTPELIEAELKDPQLAAALRAALGYVENGEWPTVGQNGKEELIKAAKRANLSLRRDLLRERLEEVEKELRELESTEAAAAADEGSTLDVADAEGQPAPTELAAPTDPAAVQQRIQQTETANPPQGVEPAAPAAEPEPAPSK